MRTLVRPSLSSKKSGFTLVEILIVVIILGILAAIVIPQFSNASTEARESAMRAMQQTVRSQVELYKLQHTDLYPTDNGVVSSPFAWTKLTGKTDAAGNASPTGEFGPYLPQTPQNSLRAGVSLVFALNDQIVVTNGTIPSIVTGVGPTHGYVLDLEGRFFALDREGRPLVN